MTEKTRTILGAVAGMFTGLFATFAGIMVYGFYLYRTGGYNTMPAELAEEALNALLEDQPFYYFIGVVVALIMTLLGGYVGARIAKRRELLVGALSSLLTSLGGLAMVFAVEEFEPLTALFMVTIFPAFSAAGGWFGRISNERSALKLRVAN